MFSRDRDVYLTKCIINLGFHRFTFFYVDEFGSKCTRSDTIASLLPTVVYSPRHNLKIVYSDEIGRVDLVLDIPELEEFDIRLLGIGNFHVERSPPTQAPHVTVLPSACREL